MDLPVARQKSERELASFQAETIIFLPSLYATTAAAVTAPFDAHSGILPFDGSIASSYYRFVIRTFASKDARALFQGNRVGRWSNIETVAMRKLAMLNRATKLADLRIPPANHLEALRGKRKGQHSIRVNNPFRICFIWRSGDAYDVEIVDYH